MGAEQYNLDFVAVQEHRWQTTENVAVINGSNNSPYKFIYNSATKGGLGGVGILVHKRHHKQIKYVNPISDRILIITFYYNP